MVTVFILKICHRYAVECGGGGISGGCRLLQVLLFGADL